MIKEQKIQAYDMLLDGASYQEISHKFGVSCSRLYVLFPVNTSTKRVSQKTLDKIIYPNLKDWIRLNRISISAFAEKAEISYTWMRNILYGEHSPRKVEIDLILKATGMTYEEAFALKAARPGQEAGGEDA